MKIKSMTIITLALVLVFAFTACQSADVIGNNAKTSFETLINKVSDKVAADEQSSSWSVASPEGERFLWSKDLAGSQDAAIEFDATPFINAGLDT